MTRISLSLATLALIVSVIACGPPRRVDGNGNGNGNGNTTNDGNAGGDGNACTNTCSADLHDIVDCHGNVVMACPAEQGCESGACADPCESAAADKSSIGCEYYAVDPDVITEGAGGCFAAYIANTWGTPVTISVDRGGSPLPLDGYARVPSGQGSGIIYAPLTNGVLQPGGVAILFLAHSGFLGMACPSGITAAVDGTDAAVHGTGIGQAFHITTSAPVVAYDIFPYGGGDSAATSATLLLPTSTWDTTYVAVDAFRKSTVVDEAQPFIEIVGQTNDSHVTIKPTAAIAGGGGVAASAQGASATYALGAGQVLQFTQDDELNGSTITSDQPVGVWGGATCLSIDVGNNACDSAHQEIPPVRALGYRYAAVRYRNRYAGQEETVPWRIIGAVDGTTLTYSPAAPAGAPTTLGLGQVVEFDSPGQFLVQSQDAQHPFYMSAHMTGWEVVAGDSIDHRGDPEFVNIIPPEQYQSAYTFFTDPTYPETNLVLTRVKQNGVFADVSLDCAGTITGWTALDTADTIEYTRVDLVTGNFQSVNGCNNGVHVATSTQPFGLVVWGWGSAASVGFFSQAVSYAYPAGAGVKPINTVVIE
jgi:hypothetical protein